MKHESLGGLQPRISFQFGLGKVSKTLPPLSTTEKSIPRRNIVESSFISSFASRWPRQVVLPTKRARVLVGDFSEKVPREPYLLPSQHKSIVHQDADGRDQISMDRGTTPRSDGRR